VGIYRGRYKENAQIKLEFTDVLSSSEKTTKRIFMLAAKVINEKACFNLRIHGGGGSIV
jgi:hypothetical protein